MGGYLDIPATQPIENHKGETVDQWLSRTDRSSTVVHAVLKLGSDDKTRTVFQIATYLEERCALLEAELTKHLNERSPASYPLRVDGPVR